MSTHPTILGEMMRNETGGEGEKTSLDVERDLGIPVKLLGLGEGLHDVAPFDPDAFVDALLAEDGS